MEYFEPDADGFPLFRVAGTKLVNIEGKKPALAAWDMPPGAIMVSVGGVVTIPVPSPSRLTVWTLLGVETEESSGGVITIEGLVPGEYPATITPQDHRRWRGRIEVTP